METMPADAFLIEVAIALPVVKTYSYAVPEELAALAQVGRRVLVPFGRRRVTGYILGPAENRGGHEVKFILDIIDEDSVE